MSDLISGKEALIALANGEEVEYYKHEWQDVNRLSVRDLTSSDSMYEFRIKPRTITINGVELNKPNDVNSYDGAVIIKCDTQNDADKLADALRSIFNESS